MFFEFCLRKKEFIKSFVFLPVSKMPLAPYDRTLGGGGGAEGRTVGQTMAGLG
jgi:hypothetical protein